MLFLIIIVATVVWFVQRKQIMTINNKIECIIRSQGYAEKLEFYEYSQPYISANTIKNNFT